MSIQWYPGHMHKAGKEMEAALPGVDVVVEVLDARLPWSSSNPALDARIGARARLRVLTRADLADPALTELWLSELGGGADASDSVSSQRAVQTGSARSARVSTRRRGLPPSRVSSMGLALL